MTKSSYQLSLNSEQNNNQLPITNYELGITFKKKIVSEWEQGVQLRIKNLR